MARARNIKPGYFLNEVLGTSDPYLQLLFAGLWTLADREGRLEDRPRRIKAEIFPYRENLDVNGYLTELSRLGFILCYKMDNSCYIQIVNFLKHQSPHHTERASIIPAYSDGCLITRDSPLCLRENPPDSLIPDSLIPDSLIPDSLIPDSLIPDSLIPDSLIQDEKRAQKKLVRSTRKKLTDEEMLEEIKTSSAYEGIDIDREFSKMQIWYTNRNRKPTMSRFINWLNRVEKPLPGVEPVKPTSFREQVNQAAVDDFVRGRSYDQ